MLISSSLEEVSCSVGKPVALDSPSVVVELDGSPGVGTVLV